MIMLVEIIELKKKYNSIVVGYKDDQRRIPEIDILVEDNQVWKADNFEAKIIIFPVIQQVILVLFF